MKQKPHYNVRPTRISIQAQMDDKLQRGILRYMLLTQPEVIKYVLLLPIKSLTPILGGAGVRGSPGIGPTIKTRFAKLLTLLDTNRSTNALTCCCKSFWSPSSSSSSSSSVPIPSSVYRYDENDRNSVGVVLRILCVV